MIKLELIEILSNLIEAFPTKWTFSSLKKSIVFASPLKELFSLLDLIKNEKTKYFESKPSMATRQCSSISIESISKILPQLIGGSADLSGSNNTNTNNNYSESNSNVNTNNTNINENNTTSNNTNRNINESKSEQTINQNITQKAPPASAIAPSIMSYSQDLCTTGVSGAFQGQVFGLSGGKAVRDENCERLKLSKYLYDTGMKVASVSILCQDPRVFKAMQMAGTPCPYEGKIGEDAKLAWKENITDRPDYIEAKAQYLKKCKGTRDKNNLKKSRLTCAREFDKGI